MKIKKVKTEKILEKVVKLDPVEFLGVCKILGIRIFKDNDGKQENPRDFSEIWYDLCDKIVQLNRTQRRNLTTLLTAATKKEERDGSKTAF
mgnify:FL=1